MGKRHCVECLACVLAGCELLRYLLEDHAGMMRVDQLFAGATNSLSDTRQVTGFLFSEPMKL